MAPQVTVAKCKECGHYRFHIKNCKNANKESYMSKCQWCNSQDHSTSNCPYKPDVK